MKKQPISTAAVHSDRLLHIPGNVPEDFANAAVTVLLLGIAAAHQWDLIYCHPPEESLPWIESILKANDTSGMVHTDLKWWEHQLRGH
ncbi:MAG TPA: hypothetical protein VMC85_21960 [Desulfomonilaceae bacterium]|nr:hypothetical protein [Desulfomonilaceae bacterium]